MDFLTIWDKFGAYAVAVVILALVVKYLYNENRKILDEQKLDSKTREKSLNDINQKVTETNQLLVESNRSLAESVSGHITQINDRLDNIEHMVEKKGAGSNG